MEQLPTSQPEIGTESTTASAFRKDPVLSRIAITRRYIIGTPDQKADEACSCSAITESGRPVVVLCLTEYVVPWIPLLTRKESARQEYADSTAEITMSAETDMISVSMLSYKRDSLQGNRKQRRL